MLIHLVNRQRSIRSHHYEPMIGAVSLPPNPRLRLDVPRGEEMSERSSGWDLEFDEPIALERGGKLVTLRNATNYITALPANEAALPEWQAAIEALILVADLSGPTMFARICER